MFMLSVYYHDILRYTIIANFDKVQELRNQGFFVQFKLVTVQGKDRARSIEADDVIVRHGSLQSRGYVLH